MEGSNPWEEHLAAVRAAQTRIRLAEAGVRAVADRHVDATMSLNVAVGNSPAATARMARAHLDKAAEALDAALYAYKAAVEVLDEYREGF